MTRARFRVVYITLMTAFALPLVLNLMTNAMDSLKHLWPYFAAATALMLATLVSNELRENRANNPEVKLGLVADRLAQSINEQWNAEADNRKINEPTRLPVPWTVIQDSPFDSWPEVQVALAQQEPRGQHPEAACSAGTLNNDDGWSSIGNLFARIPTHRLVVLGTPGGGKTVLLVELVLQLLQQQNREINWSDRPRSDKVVPVLFSLSSWNPCHKLRDWLVERLVTEHPALQAPEHGGEGASNQAQALVRQNLILPVLDGFDEIPLPMRVTALEKISEALRGQMGIVISSRYDEFQQAAKAASTQASVTPGAVAICLGDVTASSAKHYLDRSGSHRWDKVFARLGTASPVGRVLRTPLMISLAHTIYNWRPPGDGTPLPSPDELVTYDSDEKLQSHLFDASVLAAYRDRPGDAGTVLRWLKYLAEYLECGQRDPRRHRGQAESGPDDGAATATKERKSVTTDFAWWRLRASVPFPVIGLIVALPPAAAVGLVAAVTPGLGIGLGLGITTGLTVGAIIKFIGSGRRRLPEKPSSIGFGIAGGFIGALLGAAPTGVILKLTGHATTPTPPGLMGALGAGIGVGVCYGPRRGVVSAAAGGAVVALTAGAGAGVPAGIIDGLGVWIVAALTVETIGLRSPSRGIRGMRWSKVGCLTGAAAGISIGTAVALTSSPRAGLIAGLVAASVGGFAAGLEGIPADLTLAEAAAGPAELMARDRGTCWLVAVIGGTAFGLGAGLGVRLPVGLAAGLTVGLIAASIQASWLPFSLARLWFAGTGRLPLRLISLLSDAHKRGILRQEGGIYQFRHVELQRRLATQDDTSYQAPRQNMLVTPAARTHS